MNKKQKSPSKTRKAASPTPGQTTESTGSVRTSIVLPRTVDANLEVYVLRHGGSKGELITRLLVEFLEAQGYQPTKMPKVEISY